MYVSVQFFTIFFTPRHSPLQATLGIGLDGGVEPGTLAGYDGHLSQTGNLRLKQHLQVTLEEGTGVGHGVITQSWRISHGVSLCSTVTATDATLQQSFVPYNMREGTPMRSIEYNEEEILDFLLSVYLVNILFSLM